MQKCASAEDIDFVCSSITRKKDVVDGASPVRIGNDPYRVPSNQPDDKKEVSQVKTAANTDEIENKLQSVAPKKNVKRQRVNAYDGDDEYSSDDEKSKNGRNLNGDEINATFHKNIFKRKRKVEDDNDVFFQPKKCKYGAHGAFH